MRTERRTFALELHPEARSDGKLRLRGLAAVFAEALREDDPLLLWQHDASQPLARVSAGSLTLRESARGLEFEAELVPTNAATDAIALVRARVVRAMSFGFSMAGGRDRWEQRDGKPWRFISRIGRLFELSLVSEPAYAATSVEARATKATSGRLRVKERGPYEPGSEHSASSVDDRTSPCRHSSRPIPPSTRSSPASSGRRSPPSSTASSSPARTRTVRLSGLRT